MKVVQTYEGYWWPAGSGDQTAGRLEVGPERIDLKLNGRFGPVVRFEGTDYPVVHGLSGLQQITLRQAWENSSTFGTGLPTQDFVIGSVWLGAHVDAFTITGLSLQLEHLREWFELTAPRRISALQEHGAVSAAHVPRQPLRANLAGARITLQATHISTTTPTSLVLSSTAAFDAELPRPQTYDDADRDVIRPLLNLVALATTRAPAIVELAVTVPVDALAATSRASGPREVKVLASWLVRAGSDPRSLAPDELVFHARDVAADFTGALGGWISAHKAMGTACNLYFGNLVAPPRFLETKFIVHCQAAEALHAQRFPSLRMSRENHEQRVKQVLDALTPGDQVWVGMAIRNSNQKSLRDRLTELTQKAPPSVREVIGKVDVFAERVVRRRNDVTHGASLEGAVEELLALNEKLRLLVHAHLMRELGLGDDELDALIGRSRLLRSTRHFATEWLRAATVEQQSAVET
ncbi:MAG: HEPN domain-containing protein [Thermoleophilaceae bacterium]